MLRLTEKPDCMMKKAEPLHDFYWTTLDNPRDPGYTIERSGGQKPGIAPVGQGHLVCTDLQFWVRGKSKLAIRGVVFEGLDECIDMVEYEPHHALKKLRGEFAAVVWRDEKVWLCTDHVATKNLYYWSDGKDFAIGTTGGMMDAAGHSQWWRVSANKIIEVDNGRCVDCRPTWDWDFEQKYDTWEATITAFRQAVQERAELPDTAISISSGHDSNGVATQLPKPLHSITAVRGEDTLVLDMNKHHFLSQYRLSVTEPPGEKVEHYLRKTGQSFYVGKWSPAMYYIRQNATVPIIHTSMGRILSLRGFKHIITGSCDQVYDPDPMVTGMAAQAGTHRPYISPWSQAEWNTHRWPITEDTACMIESWEIFCGAFGVTALFPLMDRSVLQAWLNTDWALRMKTYKGWIEVILEDSDFQVSGIKRGMGNARL